MTMDPVCGMKVDDRRDGIPNAVCGEEIFFLLRGVQEGVRGGSE